MKAKASTVTKAKRLFETSNLPATQIGATVGLSGDTVLRYAKARNWTRPDPASASAAAPVPTKAKARAPRAKTPAKSPAAELPTLPPTLPAAALTTAERCRELFLRVLAAAERHIAVVEERLASSKIDVAGREKEVRLIAVLTRLVNDINHVLGAAPQEVPRGARAEKDGEDGVAQSADRRRQDFSDRLDALLGADPAGGVPEAVAEDD